MRTIWHLSAALVSAALLGASCSADGGSPPEQERPDWSVDCPHDVETEVVPEHMCGRVTVPLGQGEQELFFVVVDGRLVFIVFAGRGPMLLFSLGGVGLHLLDNPLLPPPLLHRRPSPAADLRARGGGHRR